MLELAGRAVRAELARQVADAVFAEDGRPEEFARLGARVGPADGGRRHAAWFEFHGEADVVPASFGEEMAGKILFVEPLADGHAADVAGDAAGRRCAVPPVEAVLPGDVAVALLGVEEIVGDEQVGMLARADASVRGRDTPAAAVGLVTHLLVLVVDEGEDVAPAFLVPRAFDQAAGADGVAGGEGLCVGDEQPPHVRLPAGAPDPGGPEDGTQQAFHAAGRDVDQELRDFAVRDRFEVAAQRGDVPIVHEVDAALDVGPGLFDELMQARLGPFQRRLVVPQFAEEGRAGGRGNRAEKGSQFRFVER